MSQATSGLLLVREIGSLRYVLGISLSFSFGKPSLEALGVECELMNYMVQIWDLASGELKLSLTGHISTVRGLAVSARHPYMFSAGEDKVCTSYDPKA